MLKYLIDLEKALGTAAGELRAAPGTMARNAAVTAGLVPVTVEGRRVKSVSVSGDGALDIKLEKKKAMVSLPMAGKTEEEILRTMGDMKKRLEGMGYTFVDSFFDGYEEDLAGEEVVQKPLWYLSKSLRKMSECDAVLFAGGWEGARGCQIEHKAAEAYGLEILYGDEN